jgi:hypothetical protein
MAQRRRPVPAGAGRVQAHDRHVDALERGGLVGEVLVQVLGEQPLTPQHAEWALLAGELR